MLQTLLICLREGLEAFLIIAIASTWLRREGRARLLGALRTGTAAAVAASIGLGWLLSRIGALSPAWEGAMALLAMAAVLGCVLHMRKAGRALRQQMASQLSVRTAPQDGMRAWWGVAVFAFFMVGREGVETATILASLAANEELRHLAWGGLLGVSIAGLLAWAWTRQGTRIDLARFFQVTSIFMVLFSVQLLIYALHEFTEAALIPGVDNAWWHLATEDIAEGRLAQLLSLALVVLPVLWLLAGAWLGRGDRSMKAGAVAGRPSP